MLFGGPLAGLSTWVTYCVQVVFGYLTTLCICSFIQSPRARVRMWGCFLFLTIGAWLLLWVPSKADPVHLVLSATSLPPTSNLHMALPVKTVWASSLLNLRQPLCNYMRSCSWHCCCTCGSSQCSLGLCCGARNSLHPIWNCSFEGFVSSWVLGTVNSVLYRIWVLPLTCYWLRSHVLLPTELIPHLDSDQLADVLRHELTHVRQHDYLWDRLAALGCRLVFFHPLVWLAYRRLRWERELACDRAVVEKHEESRLNYADCLTRLARWFAEENTRSEGIGFSSSESLLAVRVRALLCEPSADSNLGNAARAAVVAITATAALFLVPGLGLILYSPAPLSAWLRPARDLHDDSMKTPRRKAHHASLDRGVTLPQAAMVSQSELPQAVDLFINSHSTTMPL